MPEGPEAIAFELNTLKTCNDFFKKSGAPLQAHLELFPANFADGSDERSYCTATADTSRYDPSLEPIPAGYFPLDVGTSIKLHTHYDNTSPSQYANFRTLMRPTTPGPLIVRARGKQIILAAGYHLVLIHPGLEAHILEIPRKAYDDIKNHPTPGNNSDKAKAHRLQTFELPDAYCDMFSNPSKTRRTLTIMAAFVSSERAFVIIDNDRLVRMHIISLNRFWTLDDISSGGEYFSQAWAAFDSGPDWFYERKEAMEGLDQWRAVVLAMKRTKQTVLSVLCAGSTKTNISSDRFFSPFGRHTANDFIHHARLFPGQSIYDICADDTRYQWFKMALFTYMDTFRTPEYAKNCCNRSTSSNPLSFQDTVDRKYSALYMQVFRKASVTISVDHYNEFALLGYFDPQHFIGHPYACPPEALKDPARQRSVVVPVWHRQKPLNAYTIIRAKVSPTKSKQWVDGTERASVDHRLDGYKSTIGPANFTVLKNNLINTQLAIKNLKRGRPPKAKNESGARGRPRKELKNMTKAELLRQLQARERIPTHAENARSALEKHFPSLPPPSSCSLPISTRTRSGGKENDTQSGTKAKRSRGEEGEEEGSPPLKRRRRIVVV